MKLKKLTTILIAVAIVLSCAACAKNVKTTVDDASMETNSAECTEVVTETVGTTETSAITTTETTAATTQTTKKAATTVTKKKQEAPKKLGVQINTNSNKGTKSNTTTFTTTRATTGTTAASADQIKLYGIYKNAYDKTNTQKAIDADFNMDMKTSFGDQAQSVNAFGNFKVIMNGKNSKALIHETVNSDGESQNVDIFFADSYLYFSGMGMKQKIKSDISTLESQASVPLTNNRFTEQDFKYTKITTSNGFTTLTLNISSNSANNVLGSSLDVTKKWK